MRRHRFLTVVLTLLLVGGMLVVPVAGVTAEETTAAECEFPLTVEDATGEPVELSEEPDEIVVLAPNVAQHLWELDVEERVTGMPVEPWTAYLEGSEDPENVLSFDDSEGLSLPDSETIIDLDPDIVLSASIIPEDSIDELRDSDLTVYQHPQATSFAAIKEQVEQNGQLVGACEEADAIVEDITDRIDLVEQAVADSDQPRVFFDQGTVDGDVSSVNANAFEHELITTAGVENIAADVDDPTGYPLLSSEFVVGEDPEVIITPGDPETETPRESISEFPGYDSMTAVQDEQIVLVDSNLISQHAPRTVDVLEEIAEELHPDEMADARGEESGADDTGDVDDDGATDVDDVEDDADDDGPGMTIGVAVAALGIVAMLGRFRR